MPKTTGIILALLMPVMALWASAAEDPHAADRQALRALLGDVVNALNERDIDAVLKHMDNDVVVTYYNGVVTKGPAAARAYYARMLIGS